MARTEAGCLLELLDALDAFNAHQPAGSKEAAPEGTAGIQVNGEASVMIGRAVGVEPIFVYECMAGVPIKEAKALRDKLLRSQQETPRLHETGRVDPVTHLYRWATRKGVAVSHDLYIEIQQQRIERMRASGE